MQDEEKKDPLEDDLDLDFDVEDEDLEDDIDLEADADFSDLDWGDDDIEGEDFDDLDDPMSAEAPQAAPTTPQQRTFLQKYFYGVVAAVLLTLGGGWYLLTSGGGAPQQTQQAPSPDVPVVETAETPVIEEPTEEPRVGFLANEDMVSDFESQAQADTPPMPIPIAPSEDAEDTDVLTPFPGTEENAEPEILASIDEPITEDIGITISGDPELEITAEPVESVAAVPLSVEIEVTEPVATVDTAALETELAESQNRLQDAQKEHAEEIAKKDNEINNLTARLAEMQQEINTLKTQAKAKSPAPKPAPVKKAQAPVKKEKKAAPAPKAPQKWVLRSAQPGLAIISSETSNDVQTVSVGDQVPGIGRINAIAIVNGKWVVSGSQGKISQ